MFLLHPKKQKQKQKKPDNLCEMIGSIQELGVKCYYKQFHMYLQLLLTRHNEGDIIMSPTFDMRKM